MTVQLKHRFGGHKGRTEWEIHVRHDDDPILFEVLKNLPGDFKFVHTMAESTASKWATAWLHLPERTSQADAGMVVALLASGQSEALLKVLRHIDEKCKCRRA